MSDTAEESPIGIFQGDYVVESALREGLRQLRANPWMVDYIFRQLAADPLFNSQKYLPTLKAMKDWLVKTEIPVFVNTNLDPAKWPRVTVAMNDDGEADNTLADIHYEPYVAPLDSGGDDNAPDAWPALCRPFSPSSWDPGTATIGIPQEVLDQTWVFPLMKVVASNGKVYEIQDVTVDDATQATAVVLPAGTREDFSGAVIKAAKPNTVVGLESMTARVSFVVECAVEGNSWQLSVLHSVIVFLLLHFRKSLLEARGLEVSFITSSDFSRDQSLEPQVGYARYITLTGKVVHCWPAEVEETTQGVVTQLVPLDSGHLPAIDGPLKEAGWIGDEDESFGGPIGPIIPKP